MKILAVDQSYTSSGIVVFDGEEVIHAERFVTTAENSDIFERAWAVTEKIVATAKEFNVDYIGIEGLAFAKFGNATRDLAGLQWTIICTLRFVEKREIIIIPPNTVKKVATGKGNSKKVALMEALPPAIRTLFDSLGVKKTTGLLDLTDAYWIGKATQLQLQN